VCPVAFYHFDYPPARNETELRPSKYEITAEGWDHIERLSDGEKQTPWALVAGSGHDATSLTIRFDQLQPLRRITLYYPFQAKSLPSVRISSLNNGKWQTLVEEQPFKPDSMQFELGKPILGDHAQAIRFPVTMSNAVKIEVVDSGRSNHWPLTEIHLGVRDEDQPGG